ncbi:MAG: hypothetical protein JST89_20545 [Cyanobacteria bacterium SZAS-4]|nr:hypothetical protein [Cyanobacteria bacterium SZAS-4]
MATESSKNHFGTLQQFAQVFGRKSVSQEIEGQVDSFVRHNNSLIAAFKLEAQAFNTDSGRTVSQRCWRLVHDYSELNIDLEFVRNDMRAGRIQAALERIQSECWPRLMKITSGRDAEADKFRSTIDALDMLYTSVDRFFQQNVLGRSESEISKSQANSMKVLVIPGYPKEGMQMELTIEYGDECTPVDGLRSGCGFTSSVRPRQIRFDLTNTDLS